MVMAVEVEMVKALVEQEIMAMMAVMAVKAAMALKEQTVLKDSPD